MKLPPEEIRKEAKLIACCYPESIEKNVIDLIERATGEKLPEPFDESKVRDWSAWESNNCGRIDILVPVGSGSPRRPLYYVFAMGGGLGGYARDTVGVLTRPEAIAFCKDSRYLGQYDFTAGLPK